MGARRECVWTLLRDPDRVGRFTNWPALIERVDALSAEIEDPLERERFVYVGQCCPSPRSRSTPEQSYSRACNTGVVAMSLRTVWLGQHNATRNAVS